MEAHEPPSNPRKSAYSQVDIKRLGFLLFQEPHESQSQDLIQFLDGFTDTAASRLINHPMERYCKETSVHLAARNGLWKCLQALVDKFKGGNPDAVSALADLCQTPLHLAARKGYIKCTDILLKSGANMNIRNLRQETPFDLIPRGSLPRNSSNHNPVEVVFKQYMTNMKRDTRKPLVKRKSLKKKVLSFCFEIGCLSKPGARNSMSSPEKNHTITSHGMTRSESRVLEITTLGEESSIIESIEFLKPSIVIQITRERMEYSDESLGLIIDIPRGAVPRGLKMRLKIGMAFHGPFQFPDGMTPISPILVLCPEDNVPLLKPIKVTLPHNIYQATKYTVDTLGIRVIKARHSAECKFEDLNVEESKIVLESRGHKEYATFFVSHFCFISLRCDPKSKAARIKNCCIGPMYPTEFKRPCTYHLPITYYMDPWIEALKAQFSNEGYELKKNAMEMFPLENSAIIQATIIKDYDNVARLERGNANGVQVIKAELIDIWRKEFREFKNDLKMLVYPPCFCILTRVDASGFIQVHLETSEAKKFDISLVLTSCDVPLTVNAPEKGTAQLVLQSPFDALCTRFRLTSTILSSEVSDEHILDIYPQLENWKRLALHLGLTCADIRAIETEAQQDVKLMRLYSLQEWKNKELLCGGSTYRVLLRAMLDAECSLSADN